MGTAVAIRGTDGIALAVDRRIVEDGRVRSDDVNHLYTTDELAVATVGPPAAVQAAHRELEAALRRYRMDHDRPPHAPAAQRIVSDVTSDAGAPALLAVPDDQGQAQLFQIDVNGGTANDDRAAIGDGAATAIGLLEQVDREERADNLVDELERLLETAGERETTIGETIDSTVVSDRT